MVKTKKRIGKQDKITLRFGNDCEISISKSIIIDILGETLTKELKLPPQLVNQKKKKKIKEKEILNIVIDDNVNDMSNYVDE